MIKVINFGLQSPNSSLTIIQRNGKKVVLAMTININTTADKLSELDASVSVSFSIEEVPFSAAKKLLSEGNSYEDVGAFLALEDGKPVGDGHQQEIADYVRRYVKALPTSKLKRDIAERERNA